MIISQHIKTNTYWSSPLVKTFPEIEIERCSSSIIKNFDFVGFSYEVENIIGILCVGIARNGA